MSQKTSVPESILSGRSRLLQAAIRATLPMLACGYSVLGFAQAQTGAVPPAPESSAAPQGALEEITVTATRRELSLQDVPYNISALGSGALERAGLNSVNGLTRLVAGLETVDMGPVARGGNNQFSMRGLRADSPAGELDQFRSGSVASVSTYFGETPIFFPLALTDLERVEVLKGPQGTLYGSGSLAGTLRFVPHRPNFDKLEAQIDVTAGATDHSSDYNSSIDTVFNFPMGDSLALRIVSGYEKLGGFIDAVDLVQRTDPSRQTSAPVLRVPGDPSSGYALAKVEKDTNSSERWYVRPVLRWAVTDAVDAELTYLHQSVSVRDAQFENADYAGGTYLFDSYSGSPNAVNTYRPGGDFKHTADIRTPSRHELDLGSLIVTADLGLVTLTSSTSGYETKAHDLTYYVTSTQLFNPDGSLALNYYDYYNNYPRANMQNRIEQNDRSFVQEIRLISNWDKPIDYVVGAYYQDEKYNFESRTYEPGYTEYVEAIGGFGLPRPNGDLQYIFPKNYNEFRFKDKALFGELTWHITPAWQVTGGARMFSQDFDTLGRATNYYFDGAGTLDLDVDNHSDVNDTIYKFNTSYDLSSALKIYATYSEGFRRGGANALPQDGFYASLPDYLYFDADKSANHEIGVKGDLFDRRVRFTADIFYIRLDDPQVNAVSGSAFPAVFNANEAESKGAELEVEWQASDRLSTRLAYAYTDAKMSKGVTLEDYAPGTLLNDPTPVLVPIVSIPSGVRLPATPKSSFSGSVDYALPIGGSTLGLHADAAYRGSAPGYVDQASSRCWEIPSSFVANLRASYDLRTNGSVNAFVNNVTDESVYSGSVGTLQTTPNLFQQRYVGRPRSYGLGFHYKWQ